MSNIVSKFAIEGKKVVHSLTFGLNKHINEEEKVLKDTELFDKIVCLED